jgi:hypothetical protein
MAGYAQSARARWRTADQAQLTSSLQQYLENIFDSDLGDCTSEGELDDLRRNLTATGTWYEIDTEYECDLALTGIERV